MLVSAVVNVVTTGLAASIVGEKYILKDAAMAALTGAAGALGAAGSLAGLISVLLHMGVLESKEKIKLYPLQMQ